MVWETKCSFCPTNVQRAVSRTARTTVLRSLGFKNVNWLYLGTAQIQDYEDNVDVPSIGKTIKVKFHLTSAERSLDSPPPEGVAVSVTEGGRTSVQVNKYERDPRLRHQCVTALGPVCRICGFDFEAVYGDIEEGTAMSTTSNHYLKLGASMRSILLTDLLPVCPNCHAMLHSQIPALQPEELATRLNRQED